MNVTILSFTDKVWIEKLYKVKPSSSSGPAYCGLAMQRCIYEVSLETKYVYFISICSTSHNNYVRLVQTKRAKRKAVANLCILPTTFLTEFFKK